MSCSNRFNLRWVALTAVLVSSLFFTTACGGGGGGGDFEAPAVGSGPANDPPVPIPPPVVPPPGDTGGDDDDGGGDGGDDGGTEDPPPPVAPVPPLPAPPMPSWSGIENVYALATDRLTGRAWAIDGVSGVVYVKDDQGAEPIIAGVTIPNVRGLAYTWTHGTLHATVDGGPSNPDHLFLIDPDTLEATDLGAVGTHNALEGLTYLAHHGTLFSVDTETNQLVSIDPVTGVPTVVGPLGGDFEAVVGLAADEDSARLWGSDVGLGVMVEIDPLTGAATQVAVMPQGNLEALAFVPNADLFYAADPVQAKLFLADPMGTRIQMAQVLGLAYSTTDQVLFGSDVMNAMLVRIDPASGWKQYVGYTGVAQLESLAYDVATLRLYGVSTADGTLHSVDPATGAAQAVGPIAGWSTIQSLACANGQLHGIDSATGDVLQIDPNSGSAFLLGTVAFGGIQSLAFDPVGGRLHAYSDTGQLHLTIDPAAASAALIVAPRPFAAIGGLAFDPANETLWGSGVNENALVTVWTPPEPARLAFDQVHALAQDAVGQIVGFDLDQDALLQIDPDAQDAVEVRPLPGASLEGMAHDLGSDVIYATDTASQSLMLIRPGFVVEPVGAAGALGTAGIKALAHDPHNDVLYGVDIDGAGGATLVIIDQATGAVTAFGVPVGFDSIEAMAYDDGSGRLVAVDRASRALVSIDPATGVGAQMGQLDEDLADVRGMVSLPFEGALLVVDATEDRVTRIDSVTGATLP